MWAVIIAILLDTTPVETKYIKIAEVGSYQECRELAYLLKKRGLNASVFCVEKQ